MIPKLWPFQDETVTSQESQPASLILLPMGSGKTVVAIERDNRLRQARQPFLGLRGAPTLIVAPLATHEQWYDWLYRYHSVPNVFVFSEDRDKALHQLTQHQSGFYVLHWELLRFTNLRMWAARELWPVLSKTQFFHIIADEVHRSKERRTQNAKALKKLRTTYKTGLTGTVITNKPLDMFSILQWLYPREWTSYWKFVDQYAIMQPQYRGSVVYKEYVGPKNVEELQSRIRPYTVSRTKEEVLPDLPDRYYTQVRVDLAPVQRRAYDSMRRNLVAWIGENEDTPLAASATVAKLSRLQQFAIAHATFTDDGDVQLSEPSSKLDAVMEILSDTEEPVVVFSQSKSGIRLLATRLSNTGIPYSLYHGDLSKAEKRNELDRFKSGETRVFAATGQSGGEGIDGLQRAHTLIRIDRSWSHSAEDQEESRLHRAGQKDPVHVVDIVARDTVDALKNRRIIEKKYWAKLVLEGLR